MNVLLTFLEGLASFVSPCLLPLLPVYVAYFAADDAKPLTAFARAVAFALGFAAVFVALGVFAGSVGAALAAHRRAVRIVCGALVVAFGLVYLGVIRLPLRGLGAGRRSPGLAGAFLFGTVFSVSLTPCVGAFLGAALAAAASTGGALKGAGLLAAYSLGLGVPLVASATLLNRLRGAFGFVRRHYGVINPVCGGLLIAFGLWTLVGALRGEPAAEPEPAPAAETAAEKPAAEPVRLTPANFQEVVLASKTPVLLEFWMTGCGPCESLAPKIDRIAEETAGRLVVMRVHIDEVPAFADFFRLVGFPALLLFKDGYQIALTYGDLPLPQLREFVSPALE